MDEPLGTLDAEFREVMCEELRLLHDAIGATTVYVTHDQVEAMSMADLIVVMSKGEILQAAPPAEIYARPASLFVAGFIGSPAMNFLKTTAALPPGAETAAARQRGPAHPAPGRGRRASPRPCSASGRSMSASATRRRCAASVYGVEFMGPAHAAHGRHAGGPP